VTAAPARQWVTVMGGPDGAVTAAGPFRSLGRAEGFATRYEVLTDLPAQPVEVEDPAEVLSQLEPDAPARDLLPPAAHGMLL
jgi:hypothetical protein